MRKVNRIILLAICGGLLVQLVSMASGEGADGVRIPKGCRPIIASWYSIESLKEEGTWELTKGVMANGEKFNENNFTCGTRLFPLGTVLLVTNNQTLKQVQVIVTDRIGKRFATTRIDLSKRAFSEIADLEQGIVPVTVERIR